MVATPNKNLEQPARGSNVGTWDVPVNGNMGIIDNSLGGTATIALVNTPITLSPSQYQCNFIRLTGALLANVPITLPAVGSFYSIINDITNSSAFLVTMLTTAAGGQQIGIPPGAVTEIFTDGTNVRFRGLPPVGTYWDFAGSNTPAWLAACTIPPWLACNGTTFSSAVYPVLAHYLGGATLPDSRGRMRMALNAGTNRVTAGISGINGDTLLAAGGDQNAMAHSHNASVNDPTHVHAGGANPPVLVALVQGGGNPLTVPNAQQDTAAAATGISVTIASNLSGVSQNMPPTYVGGLTFVRAG